MPPHKASRLGATDTREPRAWRNPCLDGFSRHANFGLGKTQAAQDGTGALVLYERANTALAEAIAVDEILHIRDQARMLEACARVAENRDMEANALALRLRATRKLGTVIKAQKETVGLSVGTRGSRIKGARVDDKPTLASQGIKKA